ncbi:MAG TPA: hypothetical protein VNN17_03475, partial [Terriglobia bacterium]|nr:hypothetical protein [Terriglobia bacterium]
IDAAWLRNLYSFALKPDAVFYLRIGVEDLVPRVVFSHGFDYWESGLDVYVSEDMYESFCKYQSELMKQFDGLAQEYGFKIVDAADRVEAVFRRLRAGIAEVLQGEVRSGQPPAAEKRPPEGAGVGASAMEFPGSQVVGGGQPSD